MNFVLSDYDHHLTKKSESPSLVYSSYNIKPNSACFDLLAFLVIGLISTRAFIINIRKDDSIFRARHNEGRYRAQEYISLEQFQFLHTHSTNRVLGYGHGPRREVCCKYLSRILYSRRAVLARSIWPSDHCLSARERKRFEKSGCKGWRSASRRGRRKIDLW